MDNQNLNDMNQNNINSNNQPNSILNNSVQEPVQQVAPQSQPTEVEVLDDLMESTPVSFIKPPEVKKEDPNELLNSVPKPDIMISSPVSNVVSTDDLIESYVGKNYEKLSRRFYNLSAFFFGPYYFLYRKMYLYGIILLLIVLASSIGLSLINPFITLITLLIIMILSCLLFNKIYISFSRSSIEKIKKNNKTKSVSELNKICSKKGGTSILMAIVLSIVVSAALTTVVNIIMPDILLDLENKFMDTIEENTPENNDSLNNEEETPVDDKFDNMKYNGTTSYKEDIAINDKVTMGFIQIFSPTELNSDYRLDYEYKTDPNDEGSKCSFSFGAINNYKTSKELIKEMAKYHKATSSITTINNDNSNLQWDSFLYEGNLTKVHYNAIKNNDDVYLFTYEISSSANESTCEAFYNGILNSIQFK